MKTTDIISLARSWAYTDTTQYPNTDAIVDLNIIYRDMIAQINQDVNEDLFADYFYADSVLGQAEYTLPTVDNVSKINGLGNLLNVYVNYEEPILQSGTVATTNGGNTIIGTGTTFTGIFRISDNIIIGSTSYRVVNIASDTLLTIAAIDTTLPTSNASGLAFKSHIQNYKKAVPTRASNLTYPVEYYLTNQDKNEPFYIKFDHSIFVYPMPSSTIPMGVKMHGTYDVCDLTIAGDETPIVDDNYHYIMAIGLKRYIYQRLGKLAESSNAIAEYTNEFRKMINTISDTEASPLLREIPNLNFYQ